MHIARIIRRITAVLLASLLSHAAHAQIVLYDEPDFRGSQVSLDDNVRNLRDARFNDRAQSIVVSRDVWQVCRDADFRGGCITLGRGEYRNLDRDFVNSISSVRRVRGGGGGDPGRPPPPGFGEGGRGEITLYDQPDFGGRSMTLRDSAPNVGREFNDRTSSIIVRDGNWLLCVDGDFRGACMAASPGEYRSLDRTFTNSITSVRPTGGGGNGGTGPDRSPAWGPAQCSAQPRGRCEGCSVQCTRGERSSCTQGMTWDDRLNDGNPGCAVRAVCECR